MVGCSDILLKDAFIVAVGTQPRGIAVASVTIATRPSCPPNDTHPRPQTHTRRHLHHLRQAWLIHHLKPLGNNSLRDPVFTLSLSPEGRGHRGKRAHVMSGHTVVVRLCGSAAVVLAFLYKVWRCWWANIYLFNCILLPKKIKVI